MEHEIVSSKEQSKSFSCSCIYCKEKVTKFSNYFSTIHSPQAHSKQNVKRTKDKNSKRPYGTCYPNVGPRSANLILIAEICAKFCKIISGVSSAEIQRKILSLKIPSQIGPLCCQIQENANASKSGNRARRQIRGEIDMTRIPPSESEYELFCFPPREIRKYPLTMTLICRFSTFSAVFCYVISLPDILTAPVGSGQAHFERLENRKNSFRLTGKVVTR